MLTQIDPLKRLKSISINNISIQTNKLPTIDKKQNISNTKLMYTKLLNISSIISIYTISVNVCNSLHISLISYINNI